MNLTSNNKENNNYDIIVPNSTNMKSVNVNDVTINMNTANKNHTYKTIPQGKNDHFHTPSIINGIFAR